MSNSPEETDVATRCPGCGAAIHLDRIHGLCPACVWKSIVERNFDDEPPVPPAPGRTGLLNIDNHVVLEEIARGGMGIVYRARQLEPARAVALKMLLPHQAGSEEMLERFRLEVRTIAALEHPGILPIYQVGEYEGIPYFTMKLAVPGTLASRVEAFRGRFREISELIARVADAVHFAHERGVLHRDLKPGNILFDEAERPYVSDFGLAKFTEFGDGETSELTRSIQLLGTPQFLPPEVAAGGVNCATTAGDIYSLGAILYELLAGRPPFVAVGLTTLLRTIAEQEPLAPSKFLPAVPHDLEVICLKCLAKEPAERYGSAREFAEDLRRWLAGRPILARPVSVAARIRHWIQRNPALASVSVLLVLAVGSGIFLQLRTNQDLRKALGEQRVALQKSLVAQATLKRASGTVGQRFATIELLRHAASLRTDSALQAPLVALRTELAGALALPDLGPISRWPVRVAHFEGSAEFSRDLSRYVCCGKSGGLDIYETSNRVPLLSIQGSPENPAISFNFSPDGEWVSAGFEDGHVEIHPPRAQNRALNIPGQPQLRSVVEFLPDNHSAVVAGGSNGVWVVDLLDQTRRGLMPPPNIGFALTVDPAGERVAVQTLTGMEIVRIADGSVIWSQPLSSGARCICWSPDGNFVAVAKGEPLYQIAILDSSTGKELQSFHDHDVAVGRIRFHPDGHSLISTSWDGRLVWRELGPEGFRLVSDGGPRLLRFSPDGTRLAYEPSHGEVGIYEVAQPAVFKPWQRSTAPDQEAFMMALSPDGRLVATSSASRVHLWDTATGSEIASIPLPSPMWFVTVLFHPNGKSLLYSAVGIGIQQAELVAAPGKDHLEFGQIHKLAPGDELMALEFAPDGSSLIVGQNKQNVKNESKWPEIWLWPDANPTKARRLAGDWPLVGYHMSRNGRWGLTSHITEPDITVWDPTTGQRVKGLGFTDPITFELTPDGRWLMASDRQDYQLVEIGSWKRGARWPAQFGQQHYRCFTFASDSALVAIAAPNGRVELRHLPDGREITDLPSPRTTQIKALQFTRDGARLFAMTGQGGIQEWNLAELRRQLAGLGLDWKSSRPAE